jgi:hypothetical protein
MPDAPPSVAAPSEPCARCGGDADFDIASLWLCIDCYHLAGSTCAGIGRIPATTPAAVAVDAQDPADQVC